MKMFLFAVAMTAAMLTAGQVQAQPVCGPALWLLSHMQKTIGGRARVQIVTDKGALVHTWANDDKSLWAVVVVGATGQGCVLASGKGRVGTPDGVLTA